MKYLQALFLFLCLVPSTFGFAESKVSSVQNGFPNVFRPIESLIRRIIGKPRKIVCPNAFANVTDVILNQTEVVASCTTKKNVCANSKWIGVYIAAFDAENDVLTYSYTISAGKIVGDGDKIVWDLSDVPPGTYTITAGVDDGCGFCGKPMTKEVRVVECADCK